jgi:two-component system LytT family response regulator
MNRKKVIIIDERVIVRQQLRSFLNDYQAEFNLVYECDNGIEAIRRLNEWNPDIVFLGLQLPGKSGFQVLKEIEVLPKIVLLHSCNTYTMQLLEHHIIDHLPQPLDRRQFERCIQKIQIAFPKAIPQPAGSAFQDYLNCFFIESGNRLIKLKVKDILYLKAERDYCRVYTREVALLSSCGIGEMEAVLDPRTFIRIHRSFIVNIQNAEEIYKDVYKTFIRLSNGFEISIGRHYLHRIKQFIF